VGAPLSRGEAGLDRCEKTSIEPRNPREQAVAEKNETFLLRCLHRAPRIASKKQHRHKSHEWR
jgi:hypothetical protein